MTPAVALRNNRTPVFSNWRKKPSGLPRQNIERQGRIVHFAHSILGGAESAVNFLNSFHTGLGARPLDLAGESAAGFMAVQHEVERLASITGERQ
jgi:uncharacterized protein (DUF2384 family)